MNSNNITSRQSRVNYVGTARTSSTPSQQTRTASLSNRIAVDLLSGLSRLGNNVITRYFKSKLITMINKKIKSLDKQIQGFDATIRKLNAKGNNTFNLFKKSSKLQVDQMFLKNALTELTSLLPKK